MRLDVKVLRDVVYGHAPVNFTQPGGPVEKLLKLDVYLPAGEAEKSALRPTIIFAFGGAFHRGSKENDSFESEGGNTSVADYCMRFARRGYVACAIDYRLVTDDPDPGATPVLLSSVGIPTSRVDVVRTKMGLPPATPDMLWRGIEAASDDMAAAVRFVRGQAAGWHIDVDRIAIGGFSAGARTALNAAFGEKVSVAAVVALSGVMDAKDLRRHLQPGQRSPAVLLVTALNDLDYVVRDAPLMVSCLHEAGVDCQHVLVPACGHFYLAEAQAIDASGKAATVEQTIAAFLDRVHDRLCSYPLLPERATP